MSANATPKRLRVLIVDDEEPARGLMREMLATQANVEIVGEAHNGFEAVKQATQVAPDIVFLDVQMPKLDGFETFELLDSKVAVVFATAYDAYALRAFEVNAVDYLLKPFSAERLAAALEKARERLGRTNQVASTVLTAAVRAPGVFATRIVVRDGPRVVIIPVEQLDYAKGQGDYVELFSGDRSYLKQQTMQSLVDSLDGKQFVRIHRSYVLNVSRLMRIEPWGTDSKVAVLTNGAQLPMSRSGYVRLDEILGGRC